MALWIPVTIAAAVFQTLRFMLQKHLSTGQLSAAGATFARFAYSAPIVLVLTALWLGASGQPVPEMDGRFWAFALMGGLAQILATVCVVLLFKQRNFAVGITFKKTEVIQTVFVGLILLGEGVSGPAFGAILLGLVAVLLLSRTPGSANSWWTDLAAPATGLGLASGVLFAVSAVSYRGASLQLDMAEPALRAAVTLAAVTSSQMIGMGLWLAWRDRAELAAVWRARRVAVWVGLMSMGGSFCWFFAFTLQNAAYVKALGQIELILSLLASILVFREKVTAREIGGMALLGVSILALIVAV
ncbi:hypothetical protein [Marinibacterium profundimaris]|uniref:Membrane protein n=1 Tax=Marinibacterium profundimaris TaxID=1679460 RepID=A0A225NJF0_9RHOB|nr:hypothetical protein [Marinibacterium profundimaris]OWU69017.1 membrane protein [Marinibacterium profundimaris]